MSAAAQNPAGEPAASRRAGACGAGPHSAPAQDDAGHGEEHRHVLVAIVRNRPGVLNRVASLMRARSFNIETLAVSHTDQPDVSRMTITCTATTWRSNRRPSSCTA